MGSHVAEHLIGMGHKVVVLDDLSGGLRENVPDRATFVQGRLPTMTLLTRIFARFPSTTCIIWPPTRRKGSATS